MENGGGIFVSPTFHPISVEDPCPKKPQDFQKSKTSFFSLSLSVLTLTHTSYPTSKKNSHLHLQTSINKNWSTKKKTKPNNVWGSAFDGFARQSEFRRPKVMAFRWQRQQQHQHQHQLVPDSPTDNSLLTRSNSNWQQCRSRPLQRPRRDRPSRPVPHCTVSLSLWFSLFLFVFREYWDRKSTEHFHSFIFYGFLIWVLWSRGFPLMGVWKMENLNPKKMEIRSFFKQRLIIGVCGCRLFVYFWFLY